MARQQALTEREQRAGLISQALGQGRAQQALQAELGLGGAQAAFLPQQQALSMLAGGVPFSELATRSGLQGVVTQGELERAGLQALINAYEQAGYLQGEQAGTLSSLLLGGEKGPGLIQTALETDTGKKFLSNLPFVGGLFG